MSKAHEISHMYHHSPAKFVGAGHTLATLIKQALANHAAQRSQFKSMGVEAIGTLRRYCIRKIAFFVTLVFIFRLLFFIIHRFHWTGTTN